MNISSLRMKERLKVVNFLRQMCTSLVQKKYFLSLSKWSVVIPIIAALIAGIMTFRGLNESPPFQTYTPNTVTFLLTVDLILLLCVGGVIAYHIVHIWVRRRQAGSRLHVRMVTVFGLIAAVPSIIMTTFAALFLYIGLQSWFSDRVRTAVEESSLVASAYLREHQNNIRADILAMTNDLNQARFQLLNNPERFGRILTTQAALRGLTEAIVFNGITRNVLARSDFTFMLTFEPIPEDALQRARQGEIVLMVSDTDTRIRALSRLNHFVDTFLFVGRLVEPRVLARIKQTEEAVQEYTALTGQNSNIQIIVSLIFMSVSLLVFLSAVWSGLRFANYLAAPIRVLIAAAEEVRAGNLKVRVPEKKKRGDIDTLAHTFNRMTEQIFYQRQALMDSNKKLELRRRYTEMVLTGVSTGVLGLDQEGNITFFNDSALRLLEITDKKTLNGKSLSLVLPEMDRLMYKLKTHPTRLVEEQIEVYSTSKGVRTLLTRIGAIIENREFCGFVVTFDDITALLLAQRKAALSDVAQRVAHEIKNPLTPILLAAERLKKYDSYIQSDVEKFVTCTDIIIRHVRTIQNMVNEFSTFARMPQPTMERTVLQDLCRQAMFLESNAHSAINFSHHFPSTPVEIICDGRQISRALTNLLQNAIDSISETMSQKQGEISVSLTVENDTVSLCVEDNGQGLPDHQNIHKLVEPYVTTRTHGTGLGLAIVQQIMQDHQGTFSLQNRTQGGAKVCLIFPQKGTSSLSTAQNSSLISLD